MAVIFLWCGVTTPNTDKKRPNARPDPFDRQTSSTVLVVPTLNRLPPSFLNGHAEIIGLGTAMAWQNTMAVWFRLLHHPSHALEKIVSGGQIGADRTALDWEFETGPFRRLIFFAAAARFRFRFSNSSSTAYCITSARIPTVNRSAFGQSQQTKSAPLFWRRRRNSALRASLSNLAMTKVALFRLQ
jgi:hypothetical protein